MCVCTRSTASSPYSPSQAPQAPRAAVGALFLLAHPASSYTCSCAAANLQGKYVTATSFCLSAGLVCSRRIRLCSWQLGQFVPASSRQYLAKAFEVLSALPRCAPQHCVAHLFVEAVLYAA